MEIVKELEEIICERGPVKEILMDNGTPFRSFEFNKFCLKWEIRKRFRAANKASGNGIGERNGRTIKIIAEKSGISPKETICWYNLSPWTGINKDSVPSRQS